MSEFKFACPVCGQHITSDSSATGSQLNCPTCFRKIVVPQAPASAESKFVLSAAEAVRPRAPVGVPEPNKPAPSASAGVSKWTVIIGLVAMVVVGISAYAFRDKLFKTGGSSNAVSDRGGAGKPANVVAAAFPPSKSTLPWILDLSDAAFPEGPVSGKIHDRDFVAERAILQGGNLMFRMNQNQPTELGLNIFLFAKQADELSGKSATVTTNNIRSPRAVLRWKDGGQTVTRSFTNGYALRLEFGNQTGNRMPGKIYICLPDEMRSCVAGTFNAEIRKPSPPKPKPIKANQVNVTTRTEPHQ
ncbi:MAG: hypothetical protein ACTHLW_12550 [Verrucomicrobiota bacterium]